MFFINEEEKYFEVAGNKYHEGDWISLDGSTGKGYGEKIIPPTLQEGFIQIVVIDNGCGMTNQDVLKKYLQVGKKNRSDDDNEMMGRKGIGKLAAFYLSNKYYLLTKTLNEENMYEIDFTMHEQGSKSEDDDTYMRKIESCAFENKDIYDNNTNRNCQNHSNPTCHLISDKQQK